MRLALNMPLLDRSGAALDAAPAPVGVIRATGSH